MKYYNRNARKGLAQLKSEGFARYFSIPDELYMREIPDRSINPEAFSIAYCYSRVINKEPNGIYNEESKLLILPILLSRVCFIVLYYYIHYQMGLCQR